MANLVPILFSLLSLSATEAKPAGLIGIPSSDEMEFMRKFGYLERTGSDAENLYKEGTIVDAIKSMQQFGGLPETGVMDSSTRNLLSSPRCGVPDVIRNQSRNANNRTKRYSIGGEGWRKKRISYYLANWSPKLGNRENVIHQLEKAFQAWSGYSQLSFHHLNSMEADIVIFFARGHHGDGYPLDGPGMVLAHAFFPYSMGSWGGDIHFDEDENWIHGQGNGVDFFTIAAHEIGHSLGLAHSPVAGALMFPYYKGYDRNLHLDYDDILAMYQLYVMKPFEDDFQANPTPDVPEIIPEEEDEEEEETFNKTSEELENDDEDDASHDPKQDDNVSGENGHNPGSVDYDGSNDEDVLEDEESDTSRTTTPTPDGDRNDRTTTTTSPTGNRTNVPNICEGSYDAVSVIRNELFVFKGEWVWRFKEPGDLYASYPVKVWELFPFRQKVSRIDAVYERGKDRTIVIFSGREFWLFDGSKFTPETSSSISELGLPDGLDRIDAAFVWGKNGKTYLFRKNLYWRQDINGKLEDGYPLDISRWRGLPRQIDTAFKWIDGNTYFFVSKDYYRFHDQVVIVDDGYPLPAGRDWFGCD